jgi:hypothetical protein
MIIVELFPDRLLHGQAGAAAAQRQGIIRGRSCRRPAMPWWPM